MSRFRRIRRWVSVLSISFVVAVAWAVHLKQSSIDLTTGQERDCLLIAGICLVIQERPTSFSQFVPTDEIVDRDWRIFSETGPLQRISPHFTHHSTPAFLQEAMLIGDLLNVPDDLHRQMCRRVLENLRNEDWTGARAGLNRWWDKGAMEQADVRSGSQDHD